MQAQEKDLLLSQRAKEEGQPPGVISLTLPVEPNLENQLKFLLRNCSTIMLNIGLNLHSPKQDWMMNIKTFIYIHLS